MGVHYYIRMEAVVRILFLKQTFFFNVSNLRGQELRDWKLISLQCKEGKTGGGEGGF